MEVLIGTTLLSVMIFLVWLFVPRAMMLEKQLELKDYAEFLAESQVLSLRQTAASPTGPETILGPEGVSFVVTRQVRTLPEDEGEDLREGTVTVVWTYRTNETRITRKTRWTGVSY